MPICTNRKHKVENVDGSICKYLKLFPTDIIVLVSETKGSDQLRHDPKSIQIPESSKQQTKLLEIQLSFPNHLFPSYFPSH